MKNKMQRAARAAEFRAQIARGRVAHKMSPVAAQDRGVSPPGASERIKRVSMVRQAADQKRTDDPKRRKEKMHRFAQNRRAALALAPAPLPPEDQKGQRNIRKGRVFAGGGDSGQKAREPQPAFGRI